MRLSKYQRENKIYYSVLKIVANECMIIIDLNILQLAYIILIQTNISNIIQEYCRKEIYIKQGQYYGNISSLTTFIVMLKFNVLMAQETVMIPPNNSLLY